MDLASFFLQEVVIRREFYNGYYVAMAVIMAIAVFLAYHYRLMRFGGLLWLSSGMICLIWEVVLFISGARHYNFMATVELLYHALTEAGPGLIIMAVAADRWGIADLERFRDHNWKRAGLTRDKGEEGDVNESPGMEGEPSLDEAKVKGGVDHERN